MSENTKIKWTENTFNIAWGCSKVSAGCQNCYADSLASRYGHDVWGLNKPRRIFGEKHWNVPLDWNRNAEKTGKRIRVFCSSMCDVFEDHASIDRERVKLWPLIRATPWLDWQILTKRAERIADNLPKDWQEGYPNVWLGVSVENNQYVWRFNDHLAKIPAVVRFASYEPALGPVTDLDWQNLDWLIYGGESGKNFRPHDVNWAKAAKAKCDEFGVTFFYKQGSGFKPGSNPELDGKIIQEYPAPRLISSELALAA
jgi:protein gp37